MKAKKHKEKMVVVPMSVDDVENMKKCVRLKFDQHPKIKDLLMKTHGRLTFEWILAIAMVKGISFGSKKSKRFCWLWSQYDGGDSDGIKGFLQSNFGIDQFTTK